MNHPLAGSPQFSVSHPMETSWTEVSSREKLGSSLFPSHGMIHEGMGSLSAIAAIICKEKSKMSSRSSSLSNPVWCRTIRVVGNRGNKWVCENPPSCDVEGREGRFKRLKTPFLSINSGAEQ